MNLKVFDMIKGIHLSEGECIKVSVTWEEMKGAIVSVLSRNSSTCSCKCDWTCEIVVTCDDIRYTPASQVINPKLLFHCFCYTIAGGHCC